ncbi:MAG: DUF167 domain-containing protein [Syntrophobacterales bacterium]|jgi:uncharacterized protein (TIGR00251 family)|nr:DUF167 domain-containing protein [Syntrophobacterales bacterium]
MNIEIRVVTRAKRQAITREGTSLKVKLTSPPRDGKANEELIGNLATFFGIRRSDIVIVRGEKDRRKVVSVPLTEDEFMVKMAGISEGK